MVAEFEMCGVWRAKLDAACSFHNNPGCQHNGDEGIKNPSVLLFSQLCIFSDIWDLLDFLVPIHS